MGNFVAILLLVLAAALGPAPHQTWQEQVEMQIEAIHLEIAADYAYASDLLIGELEPGDSDGFELELEGYADYIIVGVCDVDCDDLDLVVYDPEEDEAAADVETDDAPVIHVRGEGTYWVEVLMPGCSAGTCLWAAQVFVKRD